MCGCESYLGGGMRGEETGKGFSSEWSGLDREWPQLYVEMSRLGVSLQCVNFFSCLVMLVGQFFDN